MRLCCDGFQCEDWQGEKSNVSLLEGYPQHFIIQTLDEAEQWLLRDDGESPTAFCFEYPDELHCVTVPCFSVKDLDFREDLVQRIQFRKVRSLHHKRNKGFCECLLGSVQTLLQLLALDLPQRSPLILPLLIELRRLLTSLRSHHHPIPPSSHSASPFTVPEDTSPNLSPPSQNYAAHAAFDPHITRQLASIMPLRALTIPSTEETWFVISRFLDGWENVYELGGCENLVAWHVRTCPTALASRVLF